MSDETVQLKAYVSEDAREAVNRVASREGVSNSEYIERLIWQDQRGEDASVLETRLEHKKSQLQAAIRARNSEQRTVESIQNEVEELQDELDDIETTSEEYERALGELQEVLDSGERVFQNCERIRDLQHEFSKPADQIYRDIRERYEEYPDEAFKLAGSHDPIDWKDAVEKRDRSRR